MSSWYVCWLFSYTSHALQCARSTMMPRSTSNCRRSCACMRAVLANLRKIRSAAHFALSQRFASRLINASAIGACSIPQLPAARCSVSNLIPFDRGSVVRYIQLHSTCKHTRLHAVRCTVALTSRLRMSAAQPPVLYLGCNSCCRCRVRMCVWGSMGLDDCRTGVACYAV